MGFRGFSLCLRGMVQKPEKLPIAIPSGSVSKKNALHSILAGSIEPDNHVLGLRIVVL